MRSLTMILGLLLLASPARAGAGRYTTYKEKTLQRLHIICGDGTREVSTYYRTLERSDTTITV
jgi:hypothetical protein